MKRTVLGCLPYLNVKPLIQSLEANPPEGYELIYETPSGLARRLQEKTCDIAAVSSFEALRSDDLVILPELAIASDGPVTSVMVFSAVPPEDIESVALDTSSLSGSALTRIVLADAYGAHPEFSRLDPDPEMMLETADACLMIGNNAMTRAPMAPYVLDLGDEWKKLTDLPFVFGLWAARRDAVDERDVEILQQARREGMLRMDEIVRERSEAMGLHLSVVRTYLSEIMAYDLGERELAGLGEFCRRAQMHGLLPASAGIRMFQHSLAV